MASSVAVLQACSAVTMSIESGSALDVVDSATDSGRNDMPVKPRRAASSVDLVHQFFARLDAVDVRAVALAP